MPDILIVGAGPTGLTLACELAVRGVPFQLIDAAEGPFSGSRAKGVQPRSLEVFDRLGIAGEIVNAGSGDLPYRQYTDDGGFRDIPRAVPEKRPDVPYPVSILIPQWRTEAALRNRLASLGARVSYGTTLVDAQADANGVRATIERNGDTGQIEAAWLVGCDGGRSTVRRVAGLNFLGETREDMRMLVGDLHVEGVDRQHWHIWRPAAGGFLAMAPLPGTDAFQLQIAIGPKGPDSPTLEVFQQMVERDTGRTDIRLSAPTWTSLWRANVRLVDRYRAGRILVAGDAAHVHTPAGGQGMNTGIQDAFNLGWKLAAVQSGADSTLLDTYEAERLPVARHVLGLSTRLADTVASSKTEGLVARNENTSQLDIHYRESPLSREMRTAPGSVRAGDRAPDAPGLLNGQHSTTLRLFDIFRGPHATLLAFGEGWKPILDAALAAAGDTVHAIVVQPAGFSPSLSLNETGTNTSDIPTFVDTLGHANTAWEPGARALFVVRPDGVIGFATDQLDIDALIDWLRLSGLIVR
ncbi:FAD-dependent monooxygenase [Paraburkholderia sp. D15]|uniref:FAD-dependent monooxygenase n=1 Tax=Paraburkholderia sp. D15 TaxID=2880218 RepID=UPI002478CD08|nr:FAD-dependent monooxygenase [Paraburkholderia sp. D15]WGS54271.1 FAD-dependent monooxygenase [Paraburkholderia sp. D15]